MDDFSDFYKCHVMVSNFYKKKGYTAARSKVPFINHINEGVLILDKIGASNYAKCAFCLHPLMQEDADFAQFFLDLSEFPFYIQPKVVALSVEYRSVANEYLSKRKITSINEIRLSPVKDVNDMLIADKIQNYKDFVLYHKKTHNRSDELEIYFKNWFQRLGITDEYYNSMLKHLELCVNKTNINLD